MPHYYPAWMEVDLSQFQQNVVAIRSYLGQRRFCLSIKANAYGLGLVPIAQAAERCGVDSLGVSSCQEGVILRKNGIQIPILVFGALHEPELEDLVLHGLEFTISSLFKAQQVAAYLEKTGQRGTVHLEVDTGMQRTGMQPATFPALYAYVRSRACFVLQGISSHFVNSEDPESPTLEAQTAIFAKIRASIPLEEQEGLLFHMANSGAVWRGAVSAFGEMVRVGGLCLGLVEVQAAVPAVLRSIGPVASLKSHVSFVKTLPAGVGVSYGPTYKTSKETRVITVPIGYGDGYRRGLSNKGQVLLRGKRYPIIGNICMDQMMVEVGEDPAYVGDEVVLLGRQGAQEISVQEMACLLDTISYEVTCAFTQRVPRVYLS
jgi:alanine racemase